MSSRSRILVFIAIALLVIGSVALAITVQAGQQLVQKGSTAVPFPSVSSGVLSPEENATNETLLAKSRELMSQCYDPTPTPSILGDKVRQQIAEQSGVIPGSIEILNEYAYDNSVKGGKRVLEALGDSVYIVIVQWVNRPENNAGRSYSILAIDQISGKQEELNVAGGLGATFDRTRSYGVSHCTPVPTVKLEPTIITTVELTRMAATVGTQ